MVDSKVLLNTKELASALNCSTSLINKLKNNGTIPFIKIGSSVRFNFKDVINKLEENN